MAGFDVVIDRETEYRFQNVSTLSGNKLRFSYIVNVLIRQMN